ncbi:hypothetical protein ACYOEI_10360 [Singulisphaera rosea]
MRRPLFGLAVLLGCSLLSPANRAQAQGFGADPFSLYYGYYLPHQAAIAAQATPIDTINAATEARAPVVSSDREGLYDPISPYGEEDFEPIRGGSNRTRVERKARSHTFPTNTHSAMANRGLGASGAYFNRTPSYYPTLRKGSYPNHNLAVGRPHRGRGGMSSMPSMPSMPGPR